MFNDELKKVSVIVVSVSSFIGVCSLVKDVGSSTLSLYVAACFVVQSLNPNIPAANVMGQLVVIFGRGLLGLLRVLRHPSAAQPARTMRAEARASLNADTAQHAEREALGPYFQLRAMLSSILTRSFACDAPLPVWRLSCLGSFAVSV